MLNVKIICRGLRLERSFREKHLASVARLPCPHALGKSGRVTYCCGKILHLVHLAAKWLALHAVEGMIGGESDTRVSAARGEAADDAS